MQFLSVLKFYPLQPYAHDWLLWEQFNSFGWKWQEPSTLQNN